VKSAPLVASSAILPAIWLLGRVCRLACSSKAARIFSAVALADLSEAMVESFISLL
jgi:hypothetical protein